MEQAYWVQAWSAHAAARKLVQQKQTGKIVLIGSTVSCMSFVGWSPYAPGKHALKGLAESLRSELLLYGIDVHIMLAPTMNTPGYETEMITKPEITKKIEEDDIPLSAEDASAILVKGVENNQYCISGNILARIFSTASRGAGPATNAFLDPILDFIGWIAIPIWRRSTDSKILATREEHQKYLSGRGFFSGTG